MIADGARVGAEDFAGVRGEAGGAGGADEGLRSGDKTGEEEERAVGGDLGVGEDGGFAEDGETAW